MELTVAPRLLGQIPLKGLVVTTDALHTQRKMARGIVAGGGDYFMVVKENQSKLHWAIELLFEWPLPGEQFGRSVSRGRHGDRWEERELLASTALKGYLDWPHLGQVCRIERRVTRKGETKVEVSYGVTSLGPDRGDPRRLRRLWREHWKIENRLHWVRDVTMAKMPARFARTRRPK